MPASKSSTTTRRKPAASDPAGYTARHLSVLEGLEAVRKRPGMYIGSTDSRGLMHCLWEIIDNSVDEALSDYARGIDVVLHADSSVEVRDDGRGIPVDAEPKTGLSGVEVVFTKLHAGGKFGGGSYAASGGLHGVGASVVNALSSRLDVEVDRAGKTYAMSFRRGEPGIFDDSAGKGPDSPFAPFTDRSELRVVGKARRGTSGTRIRYWADRQVFTKDAAIVYAELVTRARQTSFLVPGLRLVVTDERGLAGTPGEEGPHEEVFQHDGGIVEFVDHVATDDPVTDTWHLHGSGHFHETVPVLDALGHLEPTEVEREAVVDVALRWGTGYATELRSFVNIIATPKGGTHVAGFEASLLKTFRKVVEANARRLKAGNDKLEKDDVLAGLTAVLTVRLAEPQFEGQTKEVLGTSAVRGIVARVVESELTALLTSGRRGEKQQSALLLEKVVSEMKTRISARLHKETQRRKNALETSSLPAKLADCRSNDVDRSELFIVEGDSALGTAKLARNSDFQALLPIRGKILNVQKASVADMLKNAECAAIIQVIGAGSGRSFDLDAARYGKVVLMSLPGDEDVLLADPETGHLRLTAIGPAVDAFLAAGDDVPPACTVSADLRGNALRISPLKQVIRHHYTGTMHRVRTMYGREVSATRGHSIFTWRDGALELKPADEIEVGDHVVASRRLPRPSQFVTSLDLVGLLRTTGQDRAVRVEGESVREIMRQRSLARRRRELGITLADMAARIGYRQACSVSEWETGRGRPPERAFRAYLAQMSEPWPGEAVLHEGEHARWVASDDDSAHARYRRISAACWLSDLSEAEVARLDDDVVLSVRAHRDRSLPRRLPLGRDLALVLGWYTAEGSMDTRGRLRFSLGQDDAPYWLDLLSAITNVTGTDAGLEPPSDENRCRDVLVHHAMLSRVVKSLGLHATARVKSVPDVFLNAEPDVQLAYLEGWYLGDGTKGSVRDCLTWATASKDLANGVTYMLGQFGVLASVTRRKPTTTVIRGRVVRGGPAFTVSVSGRGQVARLRPLWRNAANAPLIDDWLGAGMSVAPRYVAISDDLVALPVREVESTDFDGNVYDLSVADDENFLAGFGGGLCAKNSDADVDGAHIRTLLLTLMFRYMRPLVDAGRVFAAVPPLHRVEVIHGSRAKNELVYTYSEAELQTLLEQLAKKGKRYKEPIQRYKGLGEMDADQLADTTMDPRHRALRRVKVSDAEMAEKVFELLMGNDVAPRKDFIVEGAAELDRDRIDI